MNQSSIAYEIMVHDVSRGGVGRLNPKWLIVARALNEEGPDAMPTPEEKHCLSCRLMVSRYPHGITRNRIDSHSQSGLEN